MIPCQDCGAENMIGAIFCRSCGAKLKLDEIRPETQNQKNESVLKNLQKIAGRVVGLLVLLLVAGILGAMFMPNPGASTGDLPSQQLNEAKAQYQRVLMRHRNRRTYNFTSEQVTALLNAELGLSGDPAASGGAKLVPEHVSVEFLSSQYVRVVLRSRLLGKVPVYSQVIGRTFVEDGSVQFKPYSAAAGKLPLPGSLRSVVLKRFTPLFVDKKNIGTLRSNVSMLEVSANSVAVTVGK